MYPDYFTDTIMCLRREETASSVLWTPDGEKEVCVHIFMYVCMYYMSACMYVCVDCMYVYGLRMFERRIGGGRDLCAHLYVSVCVFVNG
jgi:hypothetical protein